MTLFFPAFFLLFFFLSRIFLVSSADNGTEASDNQIDRKPKKNEVDHVFADALDRIVVQFTLNYYVSQI